MKHDRRPCLPLRRVFFLLPLLCGAVVLARADGPSADEVLAAARKAYQGRDPAAAAKQYRDFLARFADRPEAPAVRVELARCLLERPAPDGATVLEVLKPIADLNDPSLRPDIDFFLGLAERQNGAERLPEAEKRFGAAADAFAKRGDEKKRDVEWSLCARCARAEMQLRAGRAEDALKTADDVLKDPRAKDGPYRGLATYLRGTAYFVLKDNMAAGRALDQLAPFNEPSYGLAARRLLARVHERDDERAEALADYEGVVADYAARKQEAAARLKDEADALAKDPAEKARLKALAEGPTPDFVLEAAFAAGVLHFEAGRFADAHARFASAAAAAGDRLRDEARLYQGCCEVRLLQFPLAVDTLKPLAQVKNDLIADQSLFWLGVAQAGDADPIDPEAVEAANRRALETLNKVGADLARGGSKISYLSDDEFEFLHSRRVDALLERAAVQERLGQYKEAADRYATFRKQHVRPSREESALQREISARTLAGDYEESEKLAAQFEKAYPHSTLTAEILLRRAENAALGSASTPEEAARRFRQVIDKYPEFDHLPQARYGLAWLSYRAGELEKAQALLEEISGSDRRGDLAGAAYLLADCLMRTVPARADDAVAAGKLQDQLTQAAELLAGLVSDNPEAPYATDALMRLGLCKLRLSGLAAQDDERNRLAGESRAAFERVLLEYPLDDVQPHAALERARWIVRSGGDLNDAVLRLRPFAYGALQKHPLAPLAAVQLGGWMRSQENKAAEAARMLARVRRDNEKALRADPARAAWATLLQYQQALALNDAGKFPEGRAVLKELTEQAPDRPEAAEAKLVWGLGLLAEARQKVDAANQALSAPDLPAADAAAARKALDEGRKGVREAADYLEAEARKMGDQRSSPLLQARLYYEAAWVCRGLGDEEAAAERGRIQEEWRKKQPKPPEGQPAPEPPDVPLSEIPLQPSEKKARALYQALIAAAPDLPFSAEARLELAELFAQRGEHPAAVRALKEALDQEPPADLSARVGLRLSECLLAQNDAVKAVQQLQRVAGLADTPWAPQARLRAGAHLASRGEWDKAVETLAPFADPQASQNLAGVADAGLLLIGQAHAEKKDWDESAKAYERLLEGFADSGWRRHARYGVAWALHHQKKYAEAVEAYRHAFNNGEAPPDVAARSLIQTAACQVELKQYKEAAETLQSVAADVPGLHALALAEAANVQARLKQRGEAEKLWKRLVDSYPETPWAEAARLRLAGKGDDRTPPHALPEAERLLALPVQPPPPLDPLGGQQPSDQSVFEDQVEQACQAAVVARPLALKPAPAPLLHLAPPEPFEHRGAVRVRSLDALDEVPPPGTLPLPRQ
jgi:tetratricopeptide (TPR) repeat protein